MHTKHLVDNALQLALFATGLLAFYLLPVWAGIFDAEFGFNASQIGALLTADMAAGTVASFSARFWIHRVPWRPMIVLSVALATALNLACIEATQFWHFLLLRCGAGLATGAMLAFPYAAFAASKNPDKKFSIALALQIAVAAGALAVSSWLTEAAGPQALFVLTAFLTALPLIFIAGSPKRSSEESAEETLPAGRLHIREIVALAAIALFMTALTGVWAFVESIASMQNTQSMLVGLVLSGSLLFSFFGAIAPAALHISHEHKFAVPLSYLVLALAVSGLSIPQLAFVFAAAMVLYQFFFSFLMPLQAAWVAEADELGRSAVLVPVAQGVGAALGPLTAGITAARFGSQAIIILSLVLLGASFACVQLAGPRKIRLPNRG